MSDRFRLRSDVVFEPLVGRWFADLNLIPPQLAALTAKKAHIEALRSYVAAPKQHYDAARNPAYLGGPFVEVEPARVDEIRTLLDDTLRDQAGLLELAEALGALDRRIEERADGGTLEAVYASIPEPLKGKVEISYDLHHRPQLRIIEALLYRSPLYRTDLQRAILYRASDDLRSFALSTPRLKAPRVLELHRPFASREVDQIARLRWDSGSLESIRELFGVDDARGAELLDELLTSEPAREAPRYRGPGARVRYFGQASVLIESARSCVLADPTFGYETGADPERYSFADLPPQIDAVVITHAHGDHFSLEALLQIRHRVETVIVPMNNGGSLADPSLAQLLRAIGFRNVIAMDDFDALSLLDGEIVALPSLGEHGDLNIRSKAAFSIQLGDRKIFLGADAAGLDLELYSALRRQLGQPDLLLLAMESHGAPLSWGYAPMFPTPPSRKLDTERHQRAASFEEVKEIISRLEPRSYVAYALGLEPWLRHVVAVHESQIPARLQQAERIVEYCRGRDLPAWIAYGRFDQQI